MSEPNDIDGTSEGKTTTVERVVPAWFLDDSTRDRELEIRADRIAGLQRQAEGRSPC